MLCPVEHLAEPEAKGERLIQTLAGEGRGGRGLERIVSLKMRVREGGRPV